jgi:hypothetical protein
MNWKYILSQFVGFSTGGVIGFALCDHYKAALLCAAVAITFAQVRAIICNPS